MSAQRFLLSAVLATAFSAACTEADVGQPPPSGNCDLKIEPLKELMVVEPSVLSDSRSLNGANGKWSFRYAFSAIAPEGADMSAFILSWLQNWAETKEVNGFKTDRESRVQGMNDALICPWLKQTASNNCDALCGSCEKRELDLAKAPFRLVAIVNRLDLRTAPDAASVAGEGRLIYALTEGPADSGAKPLPFTLIMEYALPDSRTPRQWSDAWHALGKHATYDQGYLQELEAITEGFVARNASPQRRNGSAIAQVRTNESAFNWIWQLREFKLDSSGNLRLSPLANTPGITLNNSTLLRDVVVANREKVLAEQFVLPLAMRAGAADQVGLRWNLPNVDEPLRAAFARNTCDGCHSGENAPIDIAFHISPTREGASKLSKFVYDPENRAKDQLTVRANIMKKDLCTAP
jgi:hypothetical protein